MDANEMYLKGFIDKCAEAGIDADKLAKMAFGIDDAAAAGGGAGGAAMGAAGAGIPAGLIALLLHKLHAPSPRSVAKFTMGPAAELMAKETPGGAAELEKILAESEKAAPALQGKEKEVFSQMTEGYKKSKLPQNVGIPTAAAAGVGAGVGGAKGHEKSKEKDK
jgi:hypothetical protein